MWRIGFDINAQLGVDDPAHRQRTQPSMSYAGAGTLERSRHAGGRQRPDRHRGARALQHVGDPRGAADRRERSAQHERGDQGDADERRGHRRRSGSAGRARPVVATPGTNLEVWSKTLSGTNTRAVALLNRGSATRIDHRAVERSSASRRALRPCATSGATPISASFTGSYTASSVPSHGVVMLKVISAP